MIATDPAYQVKTKRGMIQRVKQSIIRALMLFLCAALLLLLISGVAPLHDAALLGTILTLIATLPVCVLRLHPSPTPPCQLTFYFSLDSPRPPPRS